MKPCLIPGFTTSDGKVHTDYVVAVKHEIFLVLSKAGDNVVGARRIVESLNKDTISEFVDLLEELESQIDKPSTFEIIRSE